MLKGVRKQYYRYGSESKRQWLRRAWRHMAGRVRGEERALDRSRGIVRNHREADDDLADAVDTAFHYAGYGRFWTIAPSQHPAELRWLARQAADVDPETAVEIGTQRGGSLYVWAQYLAADQIVSVDLPESAPEYVRHWAPVDRPSNPGVTRHDLFDAFDAGDRIEFVRGNSHAVPTQRRVRERVGGEIDFLLLDGDWSYAGVREDFETYGAMVGDGGLVALHDIAHPDGGTQRFWREIRDEYDTEEFVAENPRRPYNFGVGVVRP